MEEYEYNFVVDDTKPFLNYCEKNKYKIEVLIQDRKVFESVISRHLLARITTNNKKDTYLDFKNVSKNTKKLKISKESLPIKITKTNQNEIDSMLDTLGFKEVSKLHRVRYICTKEKVTFEIDHYTRPVRNVVAIEGDRQEVDKIYKEIKLLDLH